MGTIREWSRWSFGGIKLHRILRDFRSFGRVGLFRRPLATGGSGKPWHLLACSRDILNRTVLLKLAMTWQLDRYSQDKTQWSPLGDLFEALWYTSVTVRKISIIYLSGFLKDIYRLPNGLESTCIRPCFPFRVSIIIVHSRSCDVVQQVRRTFECEAHYKEV